jgi:hypothetical protein
MPWKLSTLTEPPILELCFEGTLTPAELKKAAQTTLDLAVATGIYRVLADGTALQGGHSIVDLYATVQLLTSFDFVHELKEAVLLPALPSVAADARFWENACVNRGIQVRLFDDRGAAVAWLLA